MATKLKKMRLTSVDLVRSGANQEADICLFKSAAPQDAPDNPTEHERNIFKRFLGWLRENPTEDNVEPDSNIEKADSENIYKSAITESIQSILDDDTLEAGDKVEMIDKSIGQYYEAMYELKKSYYEPEEEYDEEDRYDEIED